VELSGALTRVLPAPSPAQITGMTTSGDVKLLPTAVTASPVLEWVAGSMGVGEHIDGPLAVGRWPLRWACVCGVTLCCLPISIRTVFVKSAELSACLPDSCPPPDRQIPRR
jgi:hypothetical protein